jgi:hypothetical protein
MRRQQPQDGRGTSCRGGIRWQRKPLWPFLLRELRDQRQGLLMARR